LKLFAYLHVSITYFTFHNFKFLKNYDRNKVEKALEHVLREAVMPITQLTSFMAVLPFSYSEVHNKRQGVTLIRCMVCTFKKNAYRQGA